MSVVSNMPGIWTDNRQHSTVNELVLPTLPRRSSQRSRGRPLPLLIQTNEEGTLSKQLSNFLIPDAQRPLQDLEEGRSTTTSTPRLDELFLPSPSSELPLANSMQSQSTTSLSAPRSDELFLTAEQRSEATSPSYLVFEPVVSSVSDNDRTDWRRFDPPVELLNFQDDTPNEIREFLEPSIQNIRARYKEEIERTASSGRRGAPLGRARKVSGKPVVNVTMSGALETPVEVNQSRLSGASDLSIASSDSGYISRSPEIGSPESSRSGSRSLFAFSSRFKLGKYSRKGPVRHDDGLSPGSNSKQHLAIHLPAEEVSVAPESLTTECVSCLDDFPQTDVIKLSCHSYCTLCFKRLVDTSLESEENWPVKCCLNTIPYETIRPHITTSTRKKYCACEAEWSIPAGERIYCSAPTCSTFIPPTSFNPTLNSAECPKCKKLACTMCRNESHNGEDCPQDPNLQATIELAELEGWKRCYSCQALVEHNKGCRHMTCRCKAQFCYICGERWRTCDCTDAQLEEIQAQVLVRRQEIEVRTAQQITEAQEEAEVLAEVEAFIIAEAEREAREAEERRVVEEQERIARERIAEEERHRAEEERLATIALKFQNLGLTLEALHDRQKVLIAERYEFETGIMKKELQDALETLSIRHPQERNFLGAESQAKIADEEVKFDTEYLTRLAEERRIEDEYIEELRVFWGGNPGPEYKIREARDTLRQNQNKEYQAWDAHRRQQLRTFRQTEQRKLGALMVKQESEVKAVNGRSKIDEVEWKRKVWAEGKWIEEVVRERVAMLGEQEQQAFAEGVGQSN